LLQRCSSSRQWRPTAEVRHGGPAAAAADTAAGPKVGRLSMTELEGTWSSDCGIMTISQGEVRDESGEAAPIALTADGQLELRFAGDRWRSRYVDRDHIQWEGEGGTWARASYSAETSASSPPRRRCAAAGAADPRCLQSGCHQPLPTSGPCGSGPGWAVPGAAPAPCGGPSMSSWARGPMPQAANSPHLENLEAKVDYLTSAVAGLQGELVRLMHVRRAGAQRRARAEGFDDRTPMPSMHSGPMPPMAGMVLDENLQARRSHFGIGGPAEQFMPPGQRAPARPGWELCSGGRC